MDIYVNLKGKPHKNVGFIASKPDSLGFSECTSRIKRNSISRLVLSTTKLLKNFLLWFCCRSVWLNLAFLLTFVEILFQKIQTKNVVIFSPPCNNSKYQNIDVSCQKKRTNAKGNICFFSISVNMPKSCSRKRIHILSSFRRLCQVCSRSTPKSNSVSTVSRSVWGHANGWSETDHQQTQFVFFYSI